jgi:hypothetical protein
MTRRRPTSCSPAIDRSFDGSVVAIVGGQFRAEICGYALLLARGGSVVAIRSSAASA